MTDVYVGIDLGTSGCRACAMDAKGVVRAEADTAMPPSRRAGARSEQDSGDWWTAVATVVREVTRSPELRVRSLAVAGTSGTLLVVDENGVPLAPALMYDDARAVEHAERIARIASPNSGAHGVGSSLSRLLWLLAELKPASGTRAMHPADWITGLLRGQFDVADENNAAKLGFDAVERRWPAWMRELDLAAGLLPRVVPPGVPLSTVGPEIAEELRLPTDAGVVSGTTDGVASFLATGAGAPGDGVTILGSTLVLRVVADGPVFDRRFGAYSHRLGERWLAGGASNAGGATLRQHFSGERIRELSRQLSPDRPTGLDYYPLPARGERFPVADPQLEPRLRPRPDDDATFLQAMLEGLASIERQGYDRLSSLGAPYPRRVISGGGGAANPAWTRIRSAALGVPVERARHTGAAYGAALLARSGSGLDLEAGHRLDHDVDVASPLERTQLLPQPGDRGRGR